MDLAAIQHELRTLRLDGWLFVDHHRRDPIAYQVLNLTGAGMATRRWFYLIPAQGDPIAIVHRIEPGVLGDLPGKRHLYSAWQELHRVLKDVLDGIGSVAMQYSPMNAIPLVSLVDAGTVELITSFGVSVKSSAALVTRFQSQLTKTQRESHFAAGVLVDQVRRDAFALIGDRLRAGQLVTEFDVQSFIRDRFKILSLYSDHGPIVARNENCSDPHYEPTAERSSAIQAGDVVLIDLWAKLDQPHAVYYDVTWTASCGPTPPEAWLRIFDTATEARDAAIDLVVKSIADRKQLAGFEVDDAARAFVRAAGFDAYFVHRTGHSIGTDVHGPGTNIDNFETQDSRPILPHTCFSIEPGIYLPEFGVRSEVNMFISEDAAVVSGEIQREPVCLL